MANRIIAPQRCSGFTGLDVVVLLVVIWVLCTVGWSAWRDKADLCKYDADKFQRFLTGASAGVALSTANGGESFVLVVTPAHKLDLAGKAPSTAKSVALTEVYPEIAYKQKAEVPL
jgi:hypothetical protein